MPIVLLHQTASSSLMYEAIMRELANEFVLFAPDTPGFGGTAAPNQPATIQHYADGLYDALQTLGIRACWLFGHHTGASIAVQLTHNHPELTRKLILSGPPLLTDAQKEILSKAVFPMVVQADGSHLTQMWQRIRAKDAQASLALSQRETLLNLHAGAHYHESYHAVCAHDFAGQLATITCPTLVMAGENDSLRASLEPSFALLKHGTMRVISHANTYICDQQPQIIANVMREFFR